MYSLVFDKKALEELNKFEKKIKERIWSKLQACKQEPFRFLKHLTEVNGFKLRVGDYRVIIDADNDRKTLTILRIGHRRNIYEN